MYFYFILFCSSPIRKSDAIYIRGRSRGEGRGNEKLRGCHDCSRAIMDVSRSEHADNISPTDGLLLEQLPNLTLARPRPLCRTPPKAGEITGGGGKRRRGPRVFFSFFFWLRKLPGLFLFVMYVFVASTPCRNV